MSRGGFIQEDRIGDDILAVRFSKYLEGQRNKLTKSLRQLVVELEEF